MKRAILLTSLMLLVSAAHAYSQVTLNYQGTVTSASGPNSSAFSAGQRIAVTYTFSESAVDTNSDPNEGWFPGAVLAMGVSFPDNGVFANSGPSTSAQTINDLALPGRTADIVFVNGGLITSASTLGGESISGIFAEFTKGLRSPAVPSMITSDALPLVTLASNYNFVAIDTPSGTTYLHFSLDGQPVFRYAGVVTSASGPHAGLFPAGESVRVSYSLDPTATDSNGDPNRGAFQDSVLSLSISYPGLGIFANAETAALTQTFNNIASPSGLSSDQVFIHGGPIGSSSLLGGESISQIEVDFLSDFVTVPLEPTMLASDALPVFQLPLIESFAILRTPSGTTIVNFALTPGEGVQALIDEINELETAGTLTARQADRLTDKLENALGSIDGGRPSHACNDLRGFVRRIEDYIASGALTLAQGQPLINAADRIGVQIGCR